MRNSQIKLAGSLSIGLAMITTSIVADNWPNAGIRVVELGRGLVSGVILGAGIWPYTLNPNPSETETRLMLNSVRCTWEAGCNNSQPIDPSYRSASRPSSRSE
jgi:hypothetical protein